MFDDDSDDDADADGEPSPEFDDASFCGTARLFPLAGVTMLPGIVQPLHIFEDRYRAMMREALDQDGLIAMAVLKAGWESDYSGRPPLERVACLGKIVTHQRLEDGRYNLLLAGLRRVRIEREIEPVREFRVAEVAILDERNPPADDPAAAKLQGRLLKAFRAALSSGETPRPLEEALDAELPLSLLTDLAAYSLPLEHSLKCDLLHEPDAAIRAERLLASLAGGDDSEGEEAPFPPPFSAN